DNAASVTGEGKRGGKLQRHSRNLSGISTYGTISSCGGPQHDNASAAPLTNSFSVARRSTVLPVVFGKRCCTGGGCVFIDGRPSSRSDGRCQYSGARAWRRAGPDRGA